MTKFIYARVSTTDKGQSVDNQIHAITQAHQDCFMVITDNASGTAHPSKREGLTRLLKLVKRGDSIVITAYDRLSRNTVDFLLLLAELNAKGVSLVSLRENIDTSTASGYAMATFFMAGAQMERDNISERTKQALQRLKDNGKKLGKPVSEASQRASQMISEGCNCEEVTGQTGISRAMFYKLKKLNSETVTHTD